MSWWRRVQGKLASSAPRDELEIIAERYKILTDNLVASVIIRDANSRLLYCSPYTEVLTGYPIADMFSSDDDFFLHIIHKDDRETYIRALRVNELGDPFQFRYRFTHKSGLEMWAETRSMPLLDAEGNLVSSLSITFDITGTALYQKQIEERNRDIEDFMYMLSHDLKAPIYTVKGMCGVLRKDFRAILPPEVVELHDHVEKAALRLEQLVGGVLEYSKLTLQSPALAIVDSQRVIEDAASDPRREIVQLGGTLTLSGPFPALQADQLRVYQIFSNLFSNALKYRSPDRPPQVQVCAIPSKNPRQAVFEVSDNGRGIPSEKLDLVFRPFHRAHGDQIEGSGIGLATVKKLMEKLSGSVSVASEVGIGSTFTLTFRRAG